MKDNPSIFEWVVFVVFVLLEIVLFAMGILNPTARLDQTQNLLYSTFEIAFSLYIGYFIQKIDSMRQFRESLKQYGLSAYRRIMDIRKSIDRTIVQISRIDVNYPKNKAHDLDALRLILEGTFDTVESSIADWGEIIGQEIRKKEEAEIIQEKIIKRQEKVDLSEEDKETIAQLTTQLDRINSELPLALRREEDFAKKVQMENELLYGHHFEYVINRDRCLTLYVQPLIEIPEDIEIRMNNNQPYFIGSPPDIGEGICFVFDKDKNVIGRIVDSLAPQLRKQKYYFSEIWIAMRELHLPAEEGGAYPMYMLTDLKYIGMTSDGSQMIMQLPIDQGYAPRG